METRKYCNNQTKEQAFEMGIQLKNSVTITHEKTILEKQNGKF